jgi:hypothetical protein
MKPYRHGRACYHFLTPNPNTDLLQHALIGLEHRKAEIASANREIT